MVVLLPVSPQAMAVLSIAMHQHLRSLLEHQQLDKCFNQAQVQHPPGQQVLIQQPML